MLKFWLTFLAVLIFIFYVPKVLAAGNSFVTVVNPIRGPEFWESKEQPTDTIVGQSKILSQSNVPATWLIRFDALKDQKIIGVVDSLPTWDERGLFLEITPSWTKEAHVVYQKSASWHMAGSIFLTGYAPEDREKLIDSAFTKFKETFGFYPRSVGGWWIDNHSLSYMQQKYGITAALIVADQYSTDNYQIWGQYWSTPYYPAKRNTLMPAQSSDSKVPVVITQWASRDPVNGYGKGVEESTFSVQANDYLDYHNLSTNYFSSLIDVLTNQKFNQVNQVVVGLENSYSWQKYQNEYQKQIEVLVSKRKSGQLSLVTMQNFANWYQQRFPDLSQPQIIVAADPLGSKKIAVWFMNPYYRASWYVGQNGVEFRDIRQYVGGQDELCLDKSCQSLNFATFAIRVLDEVTNGKRILLDEGGAKNIDVKKDGEKFILTYENDAGRKRAIEFLPRDISIDGKISSIDALILQAQTVDQSKKNNLIQNNNGSTLYQGLVKISWQLVKYLLFIVLALFIPGFLLVRFLKSSSLTLNVFLSICVGFVMIALLSFVSSYLKAFWMVIIYLLLVLGIFFYKKIYQEIKLTQVVKSWSRKSSLLIIIIVLGTFFQSWAAIRSGWTYNFGLGFWGPLGHDGIWHQALINQLVKGVPPENPIFAGSTLTNYHYFFDLLVAVTFRLSKIPIVDLLYRFYPVLFSLMLGIGTYLLTMRLFKNRLASFVSLYFVYFAGSFGWIVSYLKDKNFSGESAFWINQPVSLNLNPPFAISLVLVIAIILLVGLYQEKRTWMAAALLVLLSGSIIEFKVYAAIIVLGGLLILGLYEGLFKRNFSYLLIFMASFILTGVIFFPQNQGAGGLLVWSPFWFVHSMVDFPDRLGWPRLAMARTTSLSSGNWTKFIISEVVAFIIFVVGNLGTRFIALSEIGVWFKKKLWQVPDYAFIFWMGLLALLIPTLFIQKGNSWNTIQFSYYFVYLVAIFTGPVWLSFAKKLPKNFGMIILATIFLITPINAIATFRGSLYPRPPSYLPPSENEALNFLQKQPNGTVLTYPFNKDLRDRFTDPYPLFAYETSGYVSAFSGKSTFIEDTIQNEILQAETGDYKKRIVAARDFFEFGNKAVLENNNNIRYIYLPKMININIDSDKLNLTKIFENQEVTVYQTRE